MKRRDFIKTSVMAGAALTLNFDKLGAALSSNSMVVEQVPDMVAVMGGEPFRAGGVRGRGRCHALCGGRRRVRPAGRGIPRTGLCAAPRGRPEP